MTEKANMGRLAPIKKWLGGVTKKDLIKGLVIVVATATLSAVTSFSTASSNAAPITGPGGVFKTASAVIAAIITVLGWILSTAIYHSVSRLLGGKGSLIRMFALSGYASVPLLGRQLLRFVYYSLLNQTASTATITRMNLIFDTFNVFTVAALVLTGLAVMINYGLSGKRSAFVAILPTMLILALGLTMRIYLSGASLQPNSGIFSFQPNG